MLAMRVKTVNTRLGGKTVGVGRHRYRLCWNPGIGAKPSNWHNRGRGTRPPRPALARVGAVAYVARFLPRRDSSG